MESIVRDLSIVWSVIDDSQDVAGNRLSWEIANQDAVLPQEMHTPVEAETGRHCECECSFAWTSLD
jgi:hypothetical protein